MAEDSTLRINPGYIAAQLRKAVETSRNSAVDNETRDRAQSKVNKWLAVLEGVLNGSIKVGSRTPVKAPAWATLEVMLGGFATGQLLAGGALGAHEQALLHEVGHGGKGLDQGTARGALNAYYLSEEGIAELQKMLQSRKYRIDVPEEGALLVVVWLMQHGETDAAVGILEEIADYLSQLRFYPRRAQTEMITADGVHLQVIAATVRDFERVPNRVDIETQREALLVWKPLYDKFISLWAETVEEDWPAQVYPDGWKNRAREVLAEYEGARVKHLLCKRPHHPERRFGHLRKCMEIAVRDPKALTGRQIGMIRAILHQVEKKRGLPGTGRSVQIRKEQKLVAAKPSTYQLAQQVIDKLRPLIENEVLRSPEEVLDSSQQYPPAFYRRVMRSVHAPAQELLSKGIVESSEQFSKLVAQMSARTNGLRFDDSQLRDLYTAIYRAFRNRRSLLLLDLSKQVQLNELPWVRALTPFVASDADDSAETLREVACLNFKYFPETIIPNKLTQELAFLVKASNSKVPIVEELAADIFMGRFSPKFTEACRISGRFMRGTIYATYYSLPCAQMLGLTQDENFVALCRERAYRGSSEPNGWSVAGNGVVIEQEQILTTHNLAPLFEEFDLRRWLADDLETMARNCYTYVCARQQTDFKDNWHSKLIMMKNTAYAWRQMMFFISMLPPDAVPRFMQWADQHFQKQRPEFRKRFAQTMNGLHEAIAGTTPEYCFLGWTLGKHPVS